MFFELSSDSLKAVFRCICWKILKFVYFDKVSLGREKGELSFL